MAFVAFLTFFLWYWLCWCHPFPSCVSFGVVTFCFFLFLSFYFFPTCLSPPCTGTLSRQPFLSILSRGDQTLDGDPVATGAAGRRWHRSLEGVASHVLFSLFSALRPYS